jgi:hypothetical protein
VQAAPPFRKLPERKPDRPSAAPTYLAGKSLSPAKLNPPLKNPRIAQRISPQQRTRKTAARCRVERKAAGDERESMPRKNTCRAFSKILACSQPRISPRAVGLRSPARLTRAGTDLAIISD